MLCSKDGTIAPGSQKLNAEQEIHLKSDTLDSVYVHDAQRIRLLLAKAVVLKKRPVNPG